MSRILWTLAASVLLTSACAESPTAPTRIVTAPSASLKMQAPTRNTGSLGPALGAGSATNHEDIAGWFTLIVFDFADGENQIDVARLSKDAAPGQAVDLSVGLAEDPCKTYQVDIFWLLPKAATYTISDTRNYPPVASRMVYPTSHCRTAPPPPPPPPDPVCSVDSFSQYFHTRADGIETEHITVKLGFEGVVAYMMSWGVPARFADFTPPLPQTRLQLVRQVLHVGENTMSVQLASPGQWPAWQMEWGCEPGPATLVTGYEFSFLDDDFGDFDR